jgi:hypothetical protein
MNNESVSTHNKRTVDNQSNTTVTNISSNTITPGDFDGLNETSTTNGFSTSSYKIVHKDQEAIYAFCLNEVSFSI